MKLYHGTTRAFWARTSGDGLHLTDDWHEASRYAEDASISEASEASFAEPDAVPEMIVIEFDLEAIRALPGVEIIADTGWLRANPREREDDWMRSLAQARSICITGFLDAYKASGLIHDIS